jgi:ABC-type phosphate/phosphonate transport system substrate-binding protein
MFVTKETPRYWVDLASATVTRRAFLAGIAGAFVACHKRGAGPDRPLLVVFGPHHAPRERDALRSTWAASSQLPLEFRIAASSNEAIDAVQSGRADAGLLSLFDYLYCAELFHIEAIAQLIRSGDRSTQAAELIVRADRGPTDLGGLAGKRVGLVDPYSITGFLLPVAHLREARVDFEPVWLGSHDEVIAAVRAGRVSAGGTYRGHAAMTPDLRVLATTTEVANEPLFVQARVSADVRSRLLRAVTAPHDPLVLGGIADATGFRAVSDDAYRSAAAIVKTAGPRTQDLVPEGWRRANEYRRPMWSFDP